MNSLNLTAAITTLASALAQGLTASELALLAGILVQLGDTLATIAAAEALATDRHSAKAADEV